MVYFSVLNAASRGCKHGIYFLWVHAAERAAEGCKDCENGSSECDSVEHVAEDCRDGLCFLEFDGTDDAAAGGTCMAYFARVRWW